MNIDPTVTAPGVVQPMPTKTKKHKPKKSPTQVFHKAIADLDFKEAPFVKMNSLENVPPEFMTNEHLIPFMVKVVTDIPASGDVVLAIAGMASLNLLSLIKCHKVNSDKLKYCVFVDVNKNQKIFWEQVAEAIKKSTNVQSCYENIVKVIAQKEFSHESMTINKVQFEVEILKGRSWLSSNERYRAIKHIFDNNCFCFKLMDLSVPEPMQQFVDALQKLNLKIGMVRLSNVREYAENVKMLDSYLKMIKILATGCDPKAWIWATNIRPGGNDPGSEEVSQVHPLYARVLSVAEMLDPKEFQPSPPFKKGPPANVEKLYLPYPPDLDFEDLLKPALKFKEEPTEGKGGGH